MREKEKKGFIQRVERIWGRRPISNHISVLGMANNPDQEVQAKLRGEGTKSTES